eukprot:CAMPEP_0182802070 /NCGR_PEP_ID=MMETSP0006_2-20121128/3287_1 /TAXON_ID=97485 /ORGANISM="Prymnesium parvum, Strain Texoma1" /LENGTH=61 /DNA_ID=CAMNT_0024927429 /DNA_START=526 /DNA_END=708 /DNA_ORIENTATION=+
MATAADRQEVEPIVAVSGDIATHSAAAIKGPRPPRLRGREAKRRGPVLRLERVDRWVGVAV